MKGAFFVILLQSSLEHIEVRLSDAKNQLGEHHFTIGGNWDYKHGCFDRSLDGENKVWLRIPFQVTQGSIDRERVDQQTQISFGTPFVLNHVYQEGNDEDARFMTYGGLMNQFQNPIDKDANIEQTWIDQASTLLRKIEKELYFKPLTEFN